MKKINIEGIGTLEFPAAATDEQIAADMFQFHRALIELFELRADDWKLDEEMAKPLLEACLGLVQDIIYSSANGFTAMNARSSYSRHETSSSTEAPEQGKSILGIKIK